MLFREKRNTLPNSMLTTIEINSEEKLKTHISNIHGYPISRIDFRLRGRTDPVDWKTTWYVLASFHGDERDHFILVGFTDSNNFGKL